MSLFSDTPQREDAHSQNDDARREVFQGFRTRWEMQEEIPVRRIVITGQEPFGRGKIWSYLSDLGATVRNVGELSAPGLLILGREQFRKDPVRRLLYDRRGKVLRICSQEMLLAWALTGVDPNLDSSTAWTFIDGHAGLSFVASILRSRWPGTDPLPQSKGEFHFEGPDTSPLKRLGYTVGKTSGLPQSERRSLLRTAFELERSALPGQYPEWYLQEWGHAESSTRLKKLADKIAWSCRSYRKRDDKDFDTAIDHSENDLAWLKDTFYNPLTYDFEWPSSKP